MTRLMAKLMILGTLLALSVPFDAAAQGRSRGGGGGYRQGYSGRPGYNGGGRYYGGNSYRGGGGYRYSAPSYRYYGGGRSYYYAPRYRYYGYYGVPYSYYNYGYYAPPTCAGYYDAWGRWIYYPGCIAPYYGY